MITQQVRLLPPLQWGKKTCYVIATIKHLPFVFIQLSKYKSHNTCDFKVIGRYFKRYSIFFINGKLTTNIKN